MPFFSAAVSNAPPAATPVRLTGVLGAAAGTALIVGGRLLVPGVPLVSGLGGVLFLGGVAAVAAATLLPLRFALAARRFFMGAVYGIALANVAAGAVIGTGYFLAWQPILEAWSVLKPAHAWLNLFGFVSLAIAGSLLHLLPTVVGARISRTLASMLCFAGFALGPALAAIGFIVGVGWLAVIGALLTLGGGLALAWHAAIVMRARARWTTDPDWHAFTSGSLLAGIGWFAVAGSIAAAQVVGGGATADGWSLAQLALPLGMGWAAQILVGSWSHLVPAVGPGTPEQHARQRTILGRFGRWRVVALNIGLALGVAGQVAGMPLAVQAGAVLALVTGGIAVVLLAAAFLVLVRPLSPAVPGRAPRH
jgi:nitrite reductase (NO-forming)